MYSLKIAFIPCTYIDYICVCVDDIYYAVKRQTV